MNLQTFRAPTMAECLSDVKRVMGPDAVILHTRTLTLKRFLGLRRREIVEITAGRGLNGGPRGGRRGMPGGQRFADNGGNGAGGASARSGAASGGGGVATLAPRDPAAAPRSLPEPGFLPPGPGTTEIMDQVKNLGDMMKDMMQRF